MFSLNQPCEGLCEQQCFSAQQFLWSLLLQAIAFLLPQQLLFFLAHCLPVLPAQQVMAACLSLLAFLQQAISLPQQQDIAFAALSLLWL